MRGLLKKILAILDGTPSDYGKPTQGQSIVEMAFIMPILIILIIGIIEIGWLANNYLTLQEVAKVGARRGTVLSGDNSPLAWENTDELQNVTILPSNLTGDDPLDNQNGFDDERIIARSCVNGLPQDYGGFYTFIYCQMMNSLDPLQMDPDNGIDDIVISVFAVQTLYNAPLASGGDYDFENGYGPQIDIDEYQPGYIPVVVGRYPMRANECDVLSDGGNADDVERDPFDYINNNSFPDLTNINGEAVPLELAELIAGAYYGGYDIERERQRGFAVYGQHKVEPVTVEYADGTRQTFELDCYGSEWSIYDIQERMTVSGFRFTGIDDPCRDGECVDTSADIGEYLPNQGLVLVEIWWQHHLLLNLPVFSPVMNALGDDQTTIYVWSAFPVPSVEPNIQYR